MCVGEIAAAAMPTIIPAVGVVGSVISGISAYNSSQAQASAASYQAQIDANNAQIATTNAVNERKAGYDETNKLQMQTASKVAAQRAAMGANGIAVDEGSALDLTDTTKYFGEMDALTTLSNSNSRAAAFDAQSQNYMMQSGLASQTATNYRSSSLLTALGTTATGMGQVSSSWYNYNKTSTNMGTKASAPRITS